ncbi:hypothetical protein QAD02_022838 [Eretmocerus hayati]|uniref:Uncharacterized protein n=1 Tax=Eretmocerus hayati TaxID=131215 RepID=A0ACC2PUS2_9HYME|nr:hypothetical protein QAD02_022838 [Eretmocerus hayati]
MHSPMKVFILTISSVLVVVSGQLETAFRWRYVDFVWPSALAREQALATGAFNITGALPMDVDVSQDNRVFVTFANLEGVPVRLGYITSLIGPSGPLVQPYPDWTWFQSEDCNTSIQEVYRITIDECNRL